jgi:hypothetical protein
MLHDAMPACLKRYGGPLKVNTVLIGKRDWEDVHFGTHWHCCTNVFRGHCCPKNMLQRRPAVHAGCQPRRKNATDMDWPGPQCSLPTLVCEWHVKRDALRNGCREAVSDRLMSQLKPLYSECCITVLYVLSILVT